MKVILVSLWTSADLLN